MTTATTERPASAEQTPAPAEIRPEGFVGLQLGRREVSIYLHLVRENMSIPEILAAQRRAIEIIAAHDKVNETHNKRPQPEP